MALLARKASGAFKKRAPGLIYLRGRKNCVFWSDVEEKCAMHQHSNFPERKLINNLILIIHLTTNCGI